MSICSRTFVAEKLSLPDCDESVTDRQERVPGFQQHKLAAAHVLIIGAGGLGSEIGEGLARKGVGHAEIVDDDDAEVSNLNRQLLFRENLFQNKAIALAQNLSAHSFTGTRFTAHACTIQAAVATGVIAKPDVAVTAVDNNQTRVFAAHYFNTLQVPVVFVAVDLVAEHGYCAIQEPNKACLACMIPSCVVPRKLPCRTPAVKDILKVVGGLALYAIDTLLMERKRNWNFRNVHLAGFAASEALVIGRNPDCPLCKGIA
jgi:adenylyltransferase/sulfurtransferase